MHFIGLTAAHSDYASDMDVSKGMGRIKSKRMKREERKEKKERERNVYVISVDLILFRPLSLFPQKSTTTIITTHINLHPYHSLTSPFFYCASYALAFDKYTVKETWCCISITYTTGFLLLFLCSPSPFFVNLFSLSLSFLESKRIFHYHASCW